jgi:hypothetical protein
MNRRRRCRAPTGRSDEENDAGCASNERRGLALAWPGLNHQFGCSTWARLQLYFWPAQARLGPLYRQPNKPKLTPGSQARVGHLTKHIRSGLWQCYAMNQTGSISMYIMWLTRAQKLFYCHLFFFRHSSLEIGF